MAATAKTSYTVEQTAELVEAYKAAPVKATVEAFAAKFGKSVKSIVAKLSREQVYIKPERATAGRSVRKADIRLVLELAVGAEMPSLENMTVADLEKLREFLVRES